MAYSAAIIGQGEPEAARDASPPAHHKADPVRSAIQTREGIRTYIFCLPWQENC